MSAANGRLKALFFNSPPAAQLGSQYSYRASEARFALISVEQGKESNPSAFVSALSSSERSERVVNKNKSFLTSRSPWSLDKEDGEGRERVFLPRATLPGAKLSACGAVPSSVSLSRQRGAF